MKNIRGKADEKIEDYRTTLGRLQQKFLSCAAIITEVTVLQMRDNINTQLGEMSNQISEAGA